MIHPAHRRLAELYVRGEQVGFDQLTELEQQDLIHSLQLNAKYVHPETKPQPRRFTVRECLRIQSVPDWYVLPDSISLSAQYRIVGNGVASRVAYLLGIALAEQLRGVNLHHDQHHRDYLDHRRAAVSVG